ncbi:MAG: hypothetical protein WCS94_09805 [Verrucomicrobiota bacterium]
MLKNHVAREQLMDGQVGRAGFQTNTAPDEQAQHHSHRADDAPQIAAFSRGLGEVPIIYPKRRPGKAIPPAPAERLRRRGRSASKRGNNWLQERQDSSVFHGGHSW